MVFFIVFLNFSFLVFIFLFWKKLPEFDSSTEITESPKVSLLIPFRNEEQELPTLIDSINKLDYTNLEILFINDHSDDHSIEIISKNTQKEHQILHLSSKFGKKNAITYGIKQSTGEFILTIDADCTFEEDIIIEYIKFQKKYQYDMICGMVTCKDKPQSVYNDLQKLEFLALMSSSGAFIALQKPIMCNGANLFYRKQTFLEVNGYEGNFDIPSGDDEYLLHKIANHNNSKIGYLKTSIVKTTPLQDFQSFLNQRVRWAGKWKKSTSIQSKALGLFVFSFHLLYCFYFVKTIIVCSSLFFVLWLGKFLPDFIFLTQINKSFNSKISKLALLIISTFYSFYVVLFGLLGIFSNTYTWKKRKFENNERKPEK